MKFCSECGLSITRQRIHDEGRERCVCLSCGTIHYQNPRIVVGCIVYWSNRILMCRRAQAPALGQWNIPSGFLECGETLEEGAARETFEETGVIIDPNRVELSSIMNITAIDQISITFRIELGVEPHLTPGSECLEVAFKSEDEIPEQELAWREALGSGSAPRRFFNELRSRHFSIKLITSGSNQGLGFKSRVYEIKSAADGNT